MCPRPTEGKGDPAWGHLGKGRMSRPAGWGGAHEQWVWGTSKELALLKCNTQVGVRKGPEMGLGTRQPCQGAGAQGSG